MKVVGGQKLAPTSGAFVREVFKYLILSSWSHHRGTELTPEALDVTVFKVFCYTGKVLSRGSCRYHADG